MHYQQKTNGEKNLKFKAEVTLLVVAIALFALSMFCYSYTDTTQPTSTSAGAGAEVKSFTTGQLYPFRSIAIVFVGIASLSMVTASISYSKKTKPLSPLNP